MCVAKRCTSMPDGGIETHLIVTKGAQMTLEQETDYTLEELYALEDETGTLQTIVLPGHKEDVITRQWAAQIQDMVKEPVSVLAGVHYDELEKSQLLKVIHVLDELLIKCKEILAGMIREERMDV